MIVYKYFIKIALKNKEIILLYTLIFFILSILNSTNIGKMEDNFVETKLNIGIVDYSNGELSKALRDYLEEKNNVSEISGDIEKIKEQIFLEVINAAIIIPEDLEEKIVNKENTIELYKDDRKIESYQIQNQINKFITFANGTYVNGSFDLDRVKRALKEKVEVNLINSEINGKNPSINNWFKYYFNFTSYIIMAVYIAVIGLVMTEFTNENIENRRKVSSKKLLDFDKEIYLGQLTVASFITLIFILGSIVLKGRFIGEVNFLKYVINIIVFSSSILCLTFLINNLTNNKFVINGLSNALSLGTSFISGVFVSQELLSENVLRIAKFFPVYYFVRVNEKNISSFADIRYEIIMQIMFGVAFLLMGLYFSKVKQKS